MNHCYSLVAPALFLTGLASAQLTVDFTFNPSQTAGLCGLTHDAELYAYACFGMQIDRYDAMGAFLGTIPRPGSGANDVDMDVAVEGLTLAGVAVPAGTLLFIDGETGVAEVYAVDPSTGAVLATLVTAFGNNHVVGGAYHPTRDTIFLVQDLGPGGTNGNRVAEVDTNTGAVITTFQTSVHGFSVNFGDLDVSRDSGNLFVVSSSETTIAEFTPDGTLLHEFALPTSVSSLSSISIVDNSGKAWVASNGGNVWLLDGLVAVSVPFCAANPNSTGNIGLLSAIGSTVAANNQLRLFASQMPPNAFGYFLTSDVIGGPVVPAGSQGVLCLGGSIGRYVAPGQISNTGAAGSYSLVLDLTAIPLPVGTVAAMAGTTRYFQGWHRDMNPGVTSNFTTGAAVTFN